MELSEICAVQRVRGTIQGEQYAGLDGISAQEQLDTLHDAQGAILVNSFRLAEHDCGGVFIPNT